MNIPQYGHLTNLLTMAHISTYNLEASDQVIFGILPTGNVQAGEGVFLQCTLQHFKLAMEHQPTYFRWFFHMLPWKIASFHCKVKLLEGNHAATEFSPQIKEYPLMKMKVDHVQ